MDKRKRVETIYSESGTADWSQWDQLRLSTVEQALGDEDNFEPDERYSHNVEVIKPKQGRRTQPKELGYTRRKNQEGIRRFRPRAFRLDD